jgi:hypothetical protein
MIARGGKDYEKVCVSVKPLRDYYLEHYPNDTALICMRLGYVIKRRDGSIQPDHTRLHRQLGITCESGKNLKRRMARKEVKPEVAARLANAMICDPVDLGF